MTSPSGKFARKALELFSEEGTFAITISECQKLDKIVLAFEQFGCSVEQHPHKRVLFVKPQEASVK